MILREADLRRFQDAGEIVFRILKDHVHVLGNLASICAPSSRSSVEKHTQNGVRHRFGRSRRYTSTNTNNSISQRGQPGLCGQRWWRTVANDCIQNCSWFSVRTRSVIVSCPSITISAVRTARCTRGFILFETTRETCDRQQTNERRRINARTQDQAH